MSRELTGHKVNGVNDGLSVTVCDSPGHGGACHHYRIDMADPPKVSHDPEGIAPVDIRFQNGPIKEVGVNGLTHEVLTAILIDRFDGFQSGPYACAENAEALEHFQKAQEAMLRRTKARAARGVEGTHSL